MRMSLRSRFLNMLRDRVAGDDLPLSIVLWDGAVFDFVPAPSVVIRLRSRRLLRHFLTGNIARLGQAYVAGELEVEGRLQDVLLVGVTIADRLGKTAPVPSSGAAAPPGSPQHRARRCGGAVSL